MRAAPPLVLLLRRFAAAALLVLAPAGPAAADEKEFLVALQPGFAFVKVGDRTAWGGGGGLDVAYGITDAFWLRLTGAYSAHSLPAGDKNNPGGQLSAWHAGAGVTYQVDIVRLVPFFDLAVGLLGLSQPGPRGNTTSNDFGLEIGVGAEYLIDRHVALGFVARYHAYLTNINNIPVYFYAGPRVSFRFGG